MSEGSAARWSKLGLWVGAFAGFYRPDVEEVRHLDAASKFLYSARSVILVISAQAAIIAGLLALGARRFDPLDFVLVLAGFVAAHMISNLSNDYFGYKRGHDTPDSPRMRYTVHPLASGVLDSRTLLTGIAIVSALSIRRELALGTLIARPVRGVEMHRRLAAAVAQGQPMLPAARELVRLLRAAGAGSAGVAFGDATSS